MKSDIYIGIDPGAKGAICILKPVDHYTMFLDSPYKMQQFNSIRALAESYNVRTIMIENVSSIPGASAGSNFKFGQNVGSVGMFATLTGFSVDLVRPKAWQKFVGVTKKGPAIKKEVAEIANRLYPKANLYGLRGGLLDGRSDALMIAHYAYLTYNK